MKASCELHTCFFGCLDNRSGENASASGFTVILTRCCKTVKCLCVLPLFCLYSMCTSQGLQSRARFRCLHQRCSGIALHPGGAIEGGTFASEIRSPQQPLLLLKLTRLYTRTRLQPWEQPFYIILQSAQNNRARMFRLQQK